MLSRIKISGRASENMFKDKEITAIPGSGNYITTIDADFVF